MPLPAGIGKAAWMAVKNPEATKKVLKTIVTIIVCILLLPTVILYSISFLFGEEVSINEGFDITQTEAYQSVYPIYQEHMQDVENRMNLIANSIIQAHTYSDEVEEGVYEDVCTVNVYTYRNEAGMAGLFAYLTVTDEDILNAKKYKVKRMAILSFYDSICEIEIDNRGDDYYISNRYLGAGEIAQMYFPEDDTAQSFFKDSFDNFREFLKDLDGIGDGTYWGDEDGFSGNLTIAPNGMEIPLYLQGASPWGTLAYGDGNVASSGCGPTSIAMVFTYLKGETITPDRIIKWTGNRYHTPGVGSSWSIFGACANQWDLRCYDIGRSSQQMVNALQAGQPIIASMGPGTFTSGGHFIVLRGITEDGKVLVNDPNDNEAKNHINRSFPFDLIMRESKNMWVFMP